MNASLVESRFPLLNLVEQVSRDLTPWGETAKTVRCTLVNIKYRILSEKASGLDLFDSRARRADGTVHYSGTGEVMGTHSLDQLAEKVSLLNPFDFPDSNEHLYEVKRAVRLQLELFNVTGDLIQAFKYEIKP